MTKKRSKSYDVPMPLDIGEGDYVIYSEVNDKNKRSFSLVQIQSIEGPEATVVFEKNRRDPELRKELSVPVSNIILNLGKQPVYGHVYGQLCEPHIKSEGLDAWGTIHYFRKLKKVERKLIKKAFAVSIKKLAAKGLDQFLPIDVEIRNSKGKYAGMYTYKPMKDGTFADWMLLKPDSFSNLNEITQYVLHESGHGVWYRMMSADQKAQWVELYTHYAKLNKVSAKEVHKLLSEWLDSDKTLSEYCSDLDIEEGDEGDSSDKLKAIMEQVTYNASLKLEHIEILRCSGRQFKKYWPDREVEISDLDEPIGSYAATEPEEFFAEAFKMYLSGAELPNKIKKLMKRTVAAVGK